MWFPTGFCGRQGEAPVRGGDAAFPFFKKEIMRQKERRSMNSTRFRRLGLEDGRISVPGDWAER